MPRRNAQPCLAIAAYFIGSQAWIAALPVFQDLKRRVCSLESSQWLHIDRKGRKIPSWDHEGIHHFYSFLINYPQIIQIRYSDIRRILSERYEEMFSCSLAGCYSYFSISKCQAGGVVRFFLELSWLHAPNPKC